MCVWSKPGSLWPKICCPFLSHLDSGKINQSLRQPLKCLQAWCIFQSSPSLYSKMQETWDFSRDHTPLSRERYYGKLLSHIFPIASIWLVLHSNEVQLLESIWYLDFSQKEFLCVLLNPCLPGEQESLSLLVDINTLENSVSISTFRCVNCIWVARGLSTGHLG